MSDEKPVGVEKISETTLITVVALLCGTLLAALWIIFG